MGKPKRKEQQQTSQPGKTITRLENSPYYFLDYVYIICEPDHYRLVVLHANRVLTDRTYPTLRGAKIAFARSYRNKTWKKEIENSWSHFYCPEREWLEEKKRKTRT
jgi:hypothetical protein